MDFNIQDKVKLKNPLSYLKTSDNMPMLRPPDLVAIDEVGEIIAIKSPDTVETVSYTHLTLPTNREV